MSKKHAQTLANLMRLFDPCLVFLSGYIAYFAKFGFRPVLLSYQWLIGLGCLAAFLVFWIFGQDQPLRGRSLMLRLKKVLWGWIWVALLVSAFLFLRKLGESYSRAWLMLWMFLGLGISMLSWAAIDLMLMQLRRHGFNVKWVVLVGEGELLQKVLKNLQAAKGAGYRIQQVFDTSKVESLPSDLLHFLEQGNIEEVWLALPMSAGGRLRDVWNQLRLSTVNIYFIPDLLGLSLLNHEVFQFGDLSVLSLRSTPMQGLSRLVKYLEDKMVASLILVFISPLLLLIASAINLTSPGPVFYRQLRHGMNGKTFQVFKFRSMYLHEESQQQFLTQATKQDARITPLGRFLRKTSLDELPQFINVLLGDMSVVGPRPHAVSHGEYYKNQVDAYMWRHIVKPGITGWAQVNGYRGETDTLKKMQKRIEYDLYYIEHWSVWLELKIIFLTVFKGFFHRNAY